MKTIPQIRKELLDIATTVSPSAKTKIKALVLQMFRRPYVRRAPNDSVTVTPTLLRTIKSFAIANPTWSYKRIGNKFKVASGRVSEAIAGKRAA